MRASFCRVAVAVGLSFAAPAWGQQPPGAGAAVTVEIDAADYATPPVLEQRVSGGWQPVCVAPCRRAFDSRGSYRIRGGVKVLHLVDPDTGATSEDATTPLPSGAFLLPADPGSERLQISPVFKDTYIVAIPFLALSAGCLVPSVIALADGFHAGNGVRWGVGLPLAGGAALFGAIGVFALTRSSHVFDSQGRRLAGRDPKPSLHLAPWGFFARSPGLMLAGAF